MNLKNLTLALVVGLATTPATAADLSISPAPAGVSVLTQSDRVDDCREHLVCRRFAGAAVPGDEFRTALNVAIGAQWALVEYIDHGGSRCVAELNRSREASEMAARYYITAEQGPTQAIKDYAHMRGYTVAIFSRDTALDCLATIPYPRITDAYLDGRECVVEGEGSRPGYPVYIWNISHDADEQGNFTARLSMENPYADKCSADQIRARQGFRDFAPLIEATTGRR